MGYGIALGSNCRGATPSEYLDRLSLQNRLFGDDIRLEWIVNVSGCPVIVTSQPALVGREAEKAEIVELMHRKRYEMLAEGAFYDGNGLLVFDLFPRNVIQVGQSTEEIYPIDPVIQRVTPEFADFLRGHPETINRAF